MTARWPAVVCAALVATGAADAVAAPTKQECVDASERGQSLREAHDLGEARAAFVACEAAACPEAVRDDCAARLAEVDHVLRPDAPVRPSAERQPPPYPGASTAERAAPDASASATFPAVALPAANDGGAARGAGITLAAVGGLGLVVGSVLGVVAKSTYDAALSDSCGGAAHTCNAAGARRVETAHGEAAAATVSVVVGAALAVAGVTLWATAKHHVQVTPTVGGAAIGFGGSF